MYREKPIRFTNIVFLYFYLSIPLLFNIPTIKSLGYNAFFLLISLTLFFLLFSTFINQIITNKVNFKKNKEIYILIIFLSIILMNFNNTHISFSIYLIVLFLTLIFYFILNIKFHIHTSFNKKVISSIIIFYFFLSILFAQINIGYMNIGGDIRFASMLLSPTTFGITSILLYLVLLQHLNKKTWILLFYILLIYLIYLSQSRLNLLIVLILPIFFFFIKQNFLKIKIFYFFFFFFIYFFIHLMNI